MDDDEHVRLTELYRKALAALANEQRRWKNNAHTYNRWDVQHRLWWIKRIEKEATAGLPMAVELVTRAVAIRMAG